MGDMRISGAGAAVSWQSSMAAQQTAPAVEEERLEEPIQVPSEEEDRAQSLVEMMKEAREKAEARRKSLELPKNSAQYGYAAMAAYARLSRARTQAEVSSAAGYARRCIAQFQTAMRRDSDNSERIRAAIGQLQKAVNRAGKKKRELEQEKLTKTRQVKAEQEKRQREAARLKQELCRRKSMRKIREGGYLREADIDNRLQAQLAETRMELRAQAQALASSTAVSSEYAAQQYSAQASAAAAPAAPAAEISIQA